MALSQVQKIYNCFLKYLVFIIYFSVNYFMVIKSRFPFTKKIPKCSSNIWWKNILELSCFCTLVKVIYHVCNSKRKTKSLEQLKKKNVFKKIKEPFYIFKTYLKAIVIKTEVFSEEKTCILMEQNREHTKDMFEDSFIFVFSC